MPLNEGGFLVEKDVLLGILGGGVDTFESGRGSALVRHIEPLAKQRLYVYILSI